LKSYKVKVDEFSGNLELDTPPANDESVFLKQTYNLKLPPKAIVDAIMNAPE